MSRIDPRVAGATESGAVRGAVALMAAIDAKTARAGAAEHHAPVDRAAADPSIAPPANSTSPPIGPLNSALIPVHGGDGPGGLQAALPGANVPQPQPSTTAADDATAALLSRGMAAVFQQRGGSLTLRMIPESLGPVRIRMNLDSGAVNVRLEAATPAARALLADNLAMLRGSLEAKGLTVESLTVQALPTGSAHSVALAHAPALAHANATDPTGLNPTGSDQDAGGAGSRGHGRPQDRDGGAGPGADSEQGGAQMLASEEDDGAFLGRLRLTLSAVG